ncbi:MAG TPA: SAM-dependent methyltransferase [Actinocatenispora sp.]
MERPSWAPDEIDLDRPSAARMYDSFLGGSHNFAPDRAAARAAIGIIPELPAVMRANRAFLRRAVRYAASLGIRQFLDLGSGIPTVGNVHEVARAADPDARVVYVDVDPVAVAHSRALLAGDDQTAVVEADVRDPGTLLADDTLHATLDLGRPVALLMVALLHFVPDGDDPAGLVRRYADALAPGSVLAVSHGTGDGRTEQSDRMVRLYAGTANPLTARTRAGVAALFDGFELVDPGVVFLPLWRPDSPADVPDRPERFCSYAGVGRKP